MASIGKRNIDKLKRIVYEEFYRQDLFGHTPTGATLLEYIDGRIPERWYDMHESAWAEINRVIHDEITRLTYSDKKTGARKI